MERYEFRVSKTLLEELDRIAYELSDPGPENTVTRADVLREATAKFVEEFDAETETLSRGRVDRGGDKEEVADA
jgi:metal-responsive CopG/Arc/MetJ family transcriptional regulator